MEDPVSVACPWCGETFVTFFDGSAGGQSYIEDCQVCCKPIEMTFTQAHDGSVSCRTERS